MKNKETKTKRKKPADSGKEENFRTRNSKTLLFLGVVLLLLIAGGLFGWGRSSDSDQAARLPVTVSANNRAAVLAASTQAANPPSAHAENTNLTSKNYKVESVVLGGNSGIEFMNGGQSGPIKLDDVNADLVTDQNGQTEVVLSWKSSQETVATVDYQKNQSGTPETVSDNDFAYSHTVVLSALDAGSVYNYVIKSRDYNGDEADSSRYIFYSGEPQLSLVDVLQNAVQKVFGWAMKK